MIHSGDTRAKTEPSGRTSGAAVRRRLPLLRPRWHKVLTDLWGNRIRTVLVIASIGVGLFAVGMIATVHGILVGDMRSGYEQVNPANIVIYATNFDDDMVERIRKVEGVAWAEGVRSFDVMVRTGPEAWTRMGMEASRDLTERCINTLAFDRGSLPEDKHEILVERNKLGEVLVADAGVQGDLQDRVEIKLPSGKIREMALTGVVHDLTLGAGSPGGFFLAPIQGYVETGALEWLGQPDAYNRLLVTVTETGSASREDEHYLREVANQVSEAFEDNGGVVLNAQVSGSREHPNATYVDAMAGVLFLLGALVVFLSSFLITNTLSALLKQQAQQIAIMKTVGARSLQITWLYMALIFAFAMTALAFSLPLSRQAAYRLLDFLSAPLNFSILEYRTIALSVALQVIIALVVPQAAGLAPILQGSRVKVQQALSGSGDGAGRRAKPRGTAAGGPRVPVWRRTGLRRLISRPQLISLRNTFRQKGRLVMTLITLTLGGAVFIATFNVRAALDLYVERVGRYFNADVNLTMDMPYRIAAIQEELRAMPDVERAEGWAYGRSELLLENDQTADAVQLMAPPADSLLVEPILLKGRWIQPGDANDIVLSERFMGRYPDLDVGDMLRLRVNGEESEWRVVGFFQLVGKSAGFVAYTNYDYLSQEISQANKAITFRVIAKRPQGRELTREEQDELGARIEQHLQQRGFGVTEVSAGKSLIVNTSRPLNTLTTFLLIMAVLTAVVGSIGLMGTMSMNVLDRTREIGVMRAIGASDRAVMRLVIAEGVLIGLLSWAAGTLLAAPISKLLSDTIHLAIFDARSEFVFTPVGPLYWLGLVAVLSVLASVIPARSAARLTIREALAYE